MKYIVKHSFHCRLKDKNFKIADEYETNDIERAKHLANLGLLELDEPEEYETKVIKMRGRPRAKIN